MNTRPWAASLIFTTLLFVLPFQASATQVQPARPPSAAAADHESKPVSASPVNKAKKAKASGKSNRKLSRATRSALQPLDSHAGLVKPVTRNAEGNLAAAMGRDTSNGLREPDAPAAVTTESSKAFRVTLKQENLLATDDSALVTEEATAEAGSEDQASALATGGDVLGADSVSVIDRFSNKPKAQAISNGPLRLRMHDKALRASVQIPLTAGQ